MERTGNITQVKSAVEKDALSERWIGRVFVEVGELALLIEHPWFAEPAARAWCKDTESKFYGQTSIMVMSNVRK